MGTSKIQTWDSFLCLSALTASTFKEDLISFAKVTKVNNKVVFTNEPCLLVRTSDTLNGAAIIGSKGKDNLLSSMYSYPTN